ncbi:PRTRC system protein E [Cupriavidus pinatubonensis]|uniref:PRTRC system protein E n=1 Tax=Cupriavidus pinatubonensis TaxID=248026 RepID=UPI00360A4E0B
MFTQLVPLVRASEKVVVTLTMQGDTMSVLVVPVIKNAADVALATPLSLSATPEELDEGFAAAVAEVGVARQSLAEQAEATKAILDAAKSSQSSKATKALANATTPMDTSDDEVDDREGKADGATSAQPEANADGTAADKLAGTDLASLL